MNKTRLDSLLVERDLADSPDAAGRVIRSGKVRVDGVVADKPGKSYPSEVEVEVERPPRFVGRGGFKLEEAFKTFSPDVDGRVCIDIGASTGGFTDCLLQHGAATVYAVDCGRGQLDWNLRRDERVVVMENTNARYLEAEDLSLTPSFAVVDASFISLKTLLPAICGVLARNGRIVALIKPQFEAKRDEVAPGGVVRDPQIHNRLLAEIRTFGEKKLDLRWIDSTKSPIKGPAGNIEYLSYWEKP